MAKKHFTCSQKKNTKKIYAFSFQVKLSAAESRAAMLKNVPPHLAAAYKKRFPNFWQIHEGIRLHSGKGYDAEEDPDFEVEEDEDLEGQDFSNLSIYFHN